MKIVISLNMGKLAHVILIAVTPYHWIEGGIYLGKLNQLIFTKLQMLVLKIVMVS